MLTVSQVARKANVAPNTVRNHARDFPDLFSEAARGLQGNRLFNEDDVEVICSLVALKSAGMPLAEAADRIRTQEAPPIVDVVANEPAMKPQEGQQGAFALQAIQSSLQTQIEAMHREHKAQLRRQLWSHGVAFYLGMVTMGIVFFLAWWLVNGW